MAHLTASRVSLRLPERMEKNMLILLITVTNFGCENRGGGKGLLS